MEGRTAKGSLRSAGYGRSATAWQPEPVTHAEVRRWGSLEVAALDASSHRWRSSNAITVAHV